MSDSCLIQMRTETQQSEGNVRTSFSHQLVKCIFKAPKGSDIHFDRRWSGDSRGHHFFLLTVSKEEEEALKHEGMLGFFS